MSEVVTHFTSFFILRVYNFTFYALFTWPLSHLMEALLAYDSSTLSCDAF
jgi:hypothetical protein